MLTCWCLVVLPFFFISLQCHGPFVANVHYLVSRGSSLVWHISSKHQNHHCLLCQCAWQMGSGESGLVLHDTNACRDTKLLHKRQLCYPVALVKCPFIQDKITLLVKSFISECFAMHLRVATATRSPVFSARSPVENSFFFGSLKFVSPLVGCL